MLTYCDAKIHKCPCANQPSAIVDVRLRLVDEVYGGVHEEWLGKHEGSEAEAWDGGQIDRGGVRSEARSEQAVASSAVT